MSRIRDRIVVRGRVQGVGFRWSCKDEAERLGVAGWVRNRPDGAVELVAEGDHEAVGCLVDWCRHGPRHALVTGVVSSSEQPAGETGFTVTS